MTTATVYRDDPAYDALSPSQQRRARLGGLAVELPPTTGARVSSCVVLIDLSSILHREFAIHQQDGDVNATAREVVDIRNSSTQSSHTEGGF